MALSPVILQATQKHTASVSEKVFCGNSSVYSIEKKQQKVIELFMTSIYQSSVGKQMIDLIFPFLFEDGKFRKIFRKSIK